MILRPEIIRILKREKRVCEIAIARLLEKCRLLEDHYGWTTDEFIKKFNFGEIGDEEDFFLWYSLAEAVKDWKSTRGSVEEILAAPESVDA